eukprot:scaffold139221_cov35-Tisochrysis_lutea.AAC.5
MEMGRLRLMTESCSRRRAQAEAIADVRACTGPSDWTNHAGRPRSGYPRCGRQMLAVEDWGYLIGRSLSRVGNGAVKALRGAMHDQQQCSQTNSLWMWWECAPIGWRGSGHLLQARQPAVRWCHSRW